MSGSEKVAVLGGGLIGRSWAALFRAAGKSVAIFDPDPATLCLMQAAWAQTRHDEGALLYGLPPDIDPIEGWIIMT